MSNIENNISASQNLISAIDKLMAEYEEYKVIITDSKVFENLNGKKDLVAQFDALTKQKEIIEHYFSLNEEERNFFLEKFFLGELLNDLLDLEGS